MHAQARGERVWVLWEHWSGRGITSFLMFSPPLPSRPRQLTPLSTLPKHGIWRGSHDTPHRRLLRRDLLQQIVHLINSDGKTAASACGCSRAFEHEADRAAPERSGDRTPHSRAQCPALVLTAARQPPLHGRADEQSLASSFAAWLVCLTVDPSSGLDHSTTHKNHDGSG